jgi:hypothetical protein
MSTTIEIYDLANPTAPVQRLAASEPSMSKCDMIASMLQRPEGTTMKEIMRATGWPSVSVPWHAERAGLTLIKRKQKDNCFRYWGRHHGRDDADQSAMEPLEKNRMRIRLPDDKPRYFTGSPAEIVEKLAAHPRAGFLNHTGVANYMEKISTLVRDTRADAPYIRWDTPDHFLLDAAAAGWLAIEPFDEPMEPGVVC